MDNLHDTIFYMKTNILQEFHICISVSLKLLSIFAKKTPLRMFDQVGRCKQPIKGVVKWKIKTWEIFVTLANFVHWP